MPTIQVQLSKSDLLRAVADLSGPEFEAFVSDVMALRKVRSNSTPDEEAELLQRICHSLPDETRQRFRSLNAKRRAGTLASEEHAELLHLIDQIENSDADRVDALAQLARLRKKSVNELMQEIGIQAPAYE